MKLRNLLLLFAFVGTFVVACTKESMPSTYPTAGLYIGTYTVDQIPAQGTQFFSMVLYADGSMITKGKGGDGSDLYGAGTYTITGSAFSATVNSFVKSAQGVPVTQSYTATYSNKGTLTNVSWKDTVNPFGTANTGKTSTLQRVN
jgi:hypothetical protein